MSAEEKKRDNYKAREEKRRRKTAAKERQGKGKSGGGKGKSRRSKGSIRVVQFDGWIQVCGLEADDDPPEGEDIIFDEEELREPRLPRAPEAAGVPPDVAPPEAIEEGEDEPADGLPENCNDVRRQSIETLSRLVSLLTCQCLHHHPRWNVSSTT